MVDFKKRLKKKSTSIKVNPIEIYDSLDRRSETGPLRPSQKKILEEWYYSHFNDINSIIKLHTGEGKTLIGLLLLQSKINSKEGPCLYICPNIYLAKQVKQEALKFGVPICDITQDNELPTEFVNGNKILITYVQKVFNGKSIFGLRNKSIQVGAVILDDSHACIEAINNNLTIKVKNDHQLYTDILNLFESDIKLQGEGSFLEIENKEFSTMLPIPYWAWYDKREEITRVIIKYKDDFQFIWPILKDCLENCHAFISGGYLEITPTLMPIEIFGTFSKAKNRVLMSATTQDDSFFIKGLGFDIESVSNPLTNKDLKWSGEKMILIPSLIHDDLDRDSVISYLAKPYEDKNFGIVSLAPSFGNKNQYTEIGAVVASSKDIYSLVQSLKSGQYRDTIVFVNRYDGIDLPDNSCRILIMDSKPYFDSLQYKYEEECRSDSDFINIRIAQKIEQGIGRSVRGEKDYSIIILVGGDLVKFIRSPMTSRYFSSQTRQQIEIGIQIAQFTKEDATDDSPFDTLVNVIKQALNRDEGWKTYYSEEMENMQQENQRDDLFDTIIKEYESEKSYMIGDYQRACETAQQLCDKYSHNIAERGWYLQQLARYKYRISKADSNAIQKSAFKSNTQLLIPKEGVNYRKINYINEHRTKRIKEWIIKYSNYSDMMTSLDGSLQNLSFGMPSDKFELALQEIGTAIGFISQRPDKEYKKGPDNLWCGVENQYFLIECKNEVYDTRSEISKHEAGQMNTHCGWFESFYGEEKCKRILIISTNKLSYYADFTHDVEIMRKEKLKQLKENIRNFFKEFSKYNIHEISDDKIQSFIDIHNLDIQNLTTIYSEGYKKLTAPNK